MARGTTLGTLIQMLRRELKIAESPGLGSNTRESHAQALRSAQARIWSDHDWPFKKVRRDIELAAGQRYYGLPTNMSIEGLRSIDLLYNGQWSELARGITMADYNAYNSDDDVRCDPALKWDIYNDPDNGDMLEFWPMPASNDLMTARCHGVRDLRALVADNDVADIDDLAIVLLAAADFVKDRNKQEAKAAAHIFSLRRNLSNGRTFVSGGGSNPVTSGRRPPQIVISSGGDA